MYEIEELRAPAGESIVHEIAAFLAAFVREGGLATPLPGDAEEHCWVRRMNWWWLHNPFCRTDSPLGVILRGEGGKIVGFAGFIPHDYELNGRTVPALISTTFFVGEEHRGKAMSMILRAERYARDHHMVDGSPSDKMQRILERFKYERLTHETRHMYIVRRGGVAPRALASRIGSMLCRQGSRAVMKRTARFVHQPAEIASVPSRHDNTLRRHVSREGLSWFMASGSEPKRMLAVCDAEGSLLAYGIGVVKSPRGLKVFRVLDYASFDASFDLDALFSHAANNPDVFALGELDLLMWPILNGPSPRRGFLRMQRPAATALYYKVPGTWEYHRKDALPGEGDIPLL